MEPDLATVASSPRDLDSGRSAAPSEPGRSTALACRRLLAQAIGCVMTATLLAFLSPVAPPMAAATSGVLPFFVAKICNNINWRLVIWPT